MLPFLRRKLFHELNPVTLLRANIHMYVYIIIVVTNLVTRHYLKSLPSCSMIFDKSVLFFNFFNDFFSTIEFFSTCYSE